MMKVRITREARSDLALIGSHIAKENPLRAAILLKELLSECARIGHLPKGSQFLDGFEEAGIRRRPHGNYVVLYRIKGNGIEIIHIVHGARDYRAMLSEFR